MDEMTNRELAQEIIGWTAFIFSLFFFIKPTVPFYKLISGKIPLDQTPIAFVTIFYISCFCWYLYSDMLYSTQIRLINFIGIISNGFFIIIYLIYELKKNFTDSILNFLILISGSYLIYLTLENMVENDETVGKICIGAVCLLSFFQIRNIIKIKNDKNINSIPICQAWYSLVTVSIWGCYGYMIGELYIVFPQILFGICSFIQISFFAYYKNNNKYNKINFQNDDDNDNDKESTIKAKPVKIFEKEVI